MLAVSNLMVAYNQATVIRGISVRIWPGEIVSVVGSNGAGKSTLLRCIAGLLRPSSGEIVFLNERIDGWPAFKIARKGLSLVPEGARVFSKLSVEDNLLLGTFTRDPGHMFEELSEKVYDMFPILRERRLLRAETLSGGQRQMLAIGRALMSQPRLLLLDEPTAGLAPNLAEELFEFIRNICTMGITLLIVEQRVEHALEISNRAYVVENGEIVLEGEAKEMIKSDLVRKAYLGL